MFRLVLVFLDIQYFLHFCVNFLKRAIFLRNTIFFTYFSLLLFFEQLQLIQILL